jgi:DNA-binding transcriptional LysR family regulator
MYLQALTTLRRVIEHGSYSSAAASLFISQPSASNHIRQLERMFGTRLIEMAGRHPQLTEAGHVVYDLACRIENELGDAQQQIDAILGRSKRLVTVVSNSTPLLHRLPSVIKCFWSEHPDISVKTIKKSSMEITEAVRDGTADVGIQISLYLDDSVEALPVWRDSVIAVSTKEHALVGSRAIRPQVLCKQRLIFSNGREIRTLLDSWFEARGTKPTDTMEVSSFEQVRVAVLEGLGIGFLPRHVVENDLASGRLIQHDIEDFHLSRRTYVIFRRNIGDAARWLVDKIVESARSTDSDENDELQETTPGLYSRQRRRSEATTNRA